MNRTLTITWQDPVPLAQAARTISGLEFLRAVRDGRLPPAPIQELIGMKLAEVEEGRAVWELVPAEQHYNPIGVAHAGIAATMLDSAMAARGRFGRALRARHHDLHHPRLTPCHASCRAWNSARLARWPIETTVVRGSLSCSRR